MIKVCRCSYIPAPKTGSDCTTSVSGEWVSRSSFRARYRLDKLNFMWAKRWISHLIKFPKTLIMLRRFLKDQPKILISKLDCKIDTFGINNQCTINTKIIP